jgi:hypothetical protein
MTQDDIIRMARECFADPDGSLELLTPELTEFAALIAAAQREKLAHWMRNLGYATSHGDTMEDLLDHLGTQISAGLEVEVLMEREACAKVCEGIGDGNKWSDAHDCAAAIRARSKT